MMASHEDSPNDPLPALTPASDGSASSDVELDELHMIEIRKPRDCLEKSALPKTVAAMEGTREQRNRLVNPPVTRFVKPAAVVPAVTPKVTAPVVAETPPDTTKLPTSSSLRKTFPSPDAPTKRVSFGNIEVRRYPVILGDHPDCSSGPPLSIDWDYIEKDELPVEKYESIRPSERRKSLDELELSYFTRKRILRRYSGASEEDLRRATDETHRIQRQRSQTKRRLGIQRVEEVCESLGRKFTRATRIGGKRSTDASVNAP